ncbi:CaiB/BaiF CoA-transferase family protein [Bosea sp. (in: a-proteobacteria)]|jgi:alpha-methylacyl-CoA racemase|uniref:CaiB/BaiF CoA transferase family protein n=1 Tax=Bosea sp. (in: a-proteobacteria) TaxID=1871050 RepID=UPI002DDDA566|nr:CaiB/BaiF CoA-transferase family protein [Bosea sp. (in: a-proteobacteria)]HEV2512144.1 CaiB/BaiF CoA-transferase family protein [Bosea sp. (in: a-proteobacteria)]
MSSGALAGICVVEFAAIGPAPFCGMMLADMGADVIRIDRPGAQDPLAMNAVFGRGKRSVTLDLKSAEGQARALDLIARADILIEGYRPGVMERLGLGPEPALAARPKLVYGRVTGWGRGGTAAETAGHDLNYIAMSGALWPIGQADAPPPPPINFVGDFGGGGMLLLSGVLAAHLSALRTGQGQTVDTAMMDGALIQAAMLYSLTQDGGWSSRREDNLLDGGAPFYTTYRCADDGYLAVGAIEPRFHDVLMDGLGLPRLTAHDQMDKTRWPARRAQMAALFASRSRRDWAALFAGSDACVSPVLTPAEAIHHPDHLARESFVQVDGQMQPAPPIRFGRTPSQRPAPAPCPGAQTQAMLATLSGGGARVPAGQL